VKYLLDTNDWVSFLRKSSTGLLKRLATADESEIVLCSIVLAELLYGVRRSGSSQRNRAGVQAIADRFRCVAFDDECAAAYAGIRFELEQSGVPIGPNDMLIAAIAIANDLTVVTHNVREFSRVPGLRVEDWE
jgi:tRNA(fMet)-specific endonuclease VapC